VSHFQTDNLNKLNYYKLHNFSNWYCLWRAYGSVSVTVLYLDGYVGLETSKDRLEEEPMNYANRSPSRSASWRR